MMRLSELITEIGKKIDAYYQWQICSLGTLLSGGVRFMWIFIGVPWCGEWDVTVTSPVLLVGSFSLPHAVQLAAAAAACCWWWWWWCRLVIISLSLLSYIHCVSKKRHPFYFCDIFVKFHPIMLICGRNMPQEIWNKHMYMFNSYLVLYVRTVPCKN